MWMGEIVCEHMKWIDQMRIIEMVVTTVFEWKDGMTWLWRWEVEVTQYHVQWWALVFELSESASRELIRRVSLIVAGIGRGSAQVLYHQQQRSVPGRMQQSAGPNTPQHGYNTQQPIQTVSAGYSTQQNTPAYTTQPQSQQPSSGGSAPQGYSSQQVCR